MLCPEVWSGVVGVSLAVGVGCGGVTGCPDPLGVSTVGVTFTGTLIAGMVRQVHTNPRQVKRRNA